jgi:DNA-directed RNA polymerase subunit beta'
MAKQTLGMYLLNSTLPKGVHFTGAVDAKTIESTLKDVARHDPATYVSTVNALKKIGDEMATVEGVSVGLDDIVPHYEMRDPILKEGMTAIRKAKTDDERRTIIMDVQTKIKKAAPSHPGDMAIMTKSGGRGNVVQFMKTVSTPVAANNAAGAVIPWLINRSYSEGISPSEYWIAGDEARKSVVEGKIQVTEPGEVGKLLIQNMIDQVVTDVDCGTSNGIPVDAKDTYDLADRYLARAAFGFPKNTLITSAVAQELKKHDGKVIVRSPMTCSHHHSGVCAKCMGLSEKGQQHTIGTNVGVRAAQGMSEPLTQMVLSAKHGTRTATSKGAEPAGLDAVKAMVNIPKTFIYAATLADHDGEVTHIKPAAQGGHYITVTNGDKVTQHYATPDVGVLVKPGQFVEAGDVLTEGVPKPDEVVAAKGMGYGRKYVVDKLAAIYQGAGVNIDKRHLELLARAQMGHVEIVHDPKDEFLKSDIVPFNQIRKRLEDGATEIDLESAAGRTLAEDYLYYTAGTRVTPSVIKALKGHTDKVKVSTDPLKFNFVMQSLERTPLLRPDWMARLGHRYLKASLEEGAQLNQSSDIHGLHPTPGFVYGVEFGNGTGGHY